MHTFITDAMLGRLARWLRIFGYDTVYDSGMSDDALCDIAGKESRILLTRDKALFNRASAITAVFITSDHLKEQLQELKDARGLQYPSPEFLSLCPECNGRIEPVSREEAEGVVPRFVFETEMQFSRCILCRKIYWKGSHLDRIKKLLHELESNKQPLDVKQQKL